MAEREQDTNQVPPDPRRRGIPAEPAVPEPGEGRRAASIPPDERYDGGSDGGDGGGSGSDGDDTFFTPLQGWKAWVILTGIFVAIGVAVLYVYQAGDTKTILGNQPIPADDQYVYVMPAAVNVPVGGSVQAPAKQAPKKPAAGQAATGAPAAPKQTATCPICNTTGLPVCAGCGAVMQPINGAPGVYACPVCGMAGVPVCPSCHQAMAPPAPVPKAQPVVGAPMANMGGQFYCPTCGATGLPNWAANGVPACPSCQAQMQIR